jgi:hypothetical protein
MSTVAATACSPEQAESRLFGDALSCELDLPVQFRSGSTPLRAASATMTLRALAQVDDIREVRQNTSGDERTTQVLPMQRLDAKLDLVLMLLARIVRQSEQSLSVRPVRWSRHGIRLEMGQRCGALPGTAGMLSLQPADWLPEIIELPVFVLSEGENGRGGYFLWLRFDDLGPTLEEALERHLFRLHRHLYAETRRPND